MPSLCSVVEIPSVLRPELGFLRCISIFRVPGHSLSFRHPLSSSDVFGRVPRHPLLPELRSYFVGLVGLMSRPQPRPASRPHLVSTRLPNPSRPCPLIQATPPQASAPMENDGRTRITLENAASPPRVRNWSGHIYTGIGTSEKPQRPTTNLARPYILEKARNPLPIATTPAYIKFPHIYLCRIYSLLRIVTLYIGQIKGAHGFRRK